MSTFFIIIRFVVPATLIFILCLVFVVTHTLPIPLMLLFGIPALSSFALSFNLQHMYEEQTPKFKSAVPMSPTVIDFACDWFGNPLLVEITYYVPQFPFIKNSSIVDRTLKVEAAHVIEDMKESAENTYEQATEDQKKILKSGTFLKTVSRHYVEYLLVPSFGRTVFEAGVSLFRFEV